MVWFDRENENLYVSQDDFFNTQLVVYILQLLYTSGINVAQWKFAWVNYIAAVDLDKVICEKPCDSKAMRNFKIGFYWFVFALNIVGPLILFVKQNKTLPGNIDWSVFFTTASYSTAALQSLTIFVLFFALIKIQIVFKKTQKMNRKL